MCGGGCVPALSPVVPLMCCVFNCACAGVAAASQAIRHPAATLHETGIRRTGLSFLAGARFVISEDNAEGRLRSLEARGALQLRIHGSCARDRQSVSNVRTSWGFQSACA